jgi:anthranilate synthase/indole-3-glycerol phosphate synthase/phosphoribosylanthranilate isomerase
MFNCKFHPESIASESGNTIFSNFLQWDGGLWETMVKRPERVIQLASKPRLDAASLTCGIPLSMIKKLNSTSSNSILEQIRAQRLLDVDSYERIPGRSRFHLEMSLLLVAPTLKCFKSTLGKSIDLKGLAVIAEIKRASPSKGDIDINAHAASQALVYARGEAAAISVLTEPKWFKGTMHDLSEVRKAIEHLPNRPCVLCKDFILTEYQILEARIAGADTILLIVAILSQPLLLKLLCFSRSLGMEPLVEVASDEEMKRALLADSQIIGINNRNLHTFVVDMERTNRLAADIPESITVLALSGIYNRLDVVRYLSGGVKGILVGQVLFRV